MQPDHVANRPLKQQVLLVSRDNPVGGTSCERR